MPERNYLSTFQPYPRRRSQRGVVATFPLRYTSPSTSTMCIHEPSDVIRVDNVWSSQYNSPAPNHDYIADRRALPATIDRVDASNIVTPSLAPSGACILVSIGMTF